MTTVVKDKDELELKDHMDISSEIFQFQYFILHLLLIVDTNIICGSSYIPDTEQEI